MLKNASGAPNVTIGLDLGDRTARAYVMDRDRNWLGNHTIPMTDTAMRGAFHEYPSGRIVMEVGTHSPWVSRIFAERGFDVIVANPRRAQLIAKSYNKNDGTDAELLCRQGYSDPELLSPVTHRGVEAQRDLATLRTRAAMIRARTLLINSLRGQVKAAGCRVPRCSAEAFPKRAREVLTDDLYPGMGSVLASITDLSAQIGAMDAHVTAAAKRHRVTELLRQVPGVGPLTALYFVLTLEDPHRFRRSRDVGAYVGLCPRQRQSGKANPEMPITKAGDEALRRLLVIAARKILQQKSPDSDLKRFGLRIAATGGRAAKNRAAVAVARKLAVLLHALWVRGEVYQPLGYSEQSAQLSEAVLAAHRPRKGPADGGLSRRRPERPRPTARSSSVAGSRGGKRIASSSASARR